MNKVYIRWKDPITGQQERMLEQMALTVGRDASNEIVLKGNNVSRHHAVIERQDDQVIVRDVGSSNGVRLNGKRVQRAAIQNDAVIQVGDFSLLVTVESFETVILGDTTVITASVPDDVTVISPNIPDDTTVVAASPRDAATVVAPRIANKPAGQTPHNAEDVMTLVSPVLRAPARTKQPSTPRAPSAAPQPDWPPAIFNQKLVSVQALQRLGLPILTTEYATIGAGMGSFVWTDLLRVSGVKADQVAALGMDPRPYAHYKLLTRNSQIPDHERLRSNSESTPDNIWGWPGYAVREIWSDFWHGNIGRAWGTFWQIFGEPALTDTYTPKIGNVFRALDRESRRIDWDKIMRYGRVRAIRKTDDGRYVIAYSTRTADQSADEPAHALAIARYVHLATGYPAIQFLKDLQQYRAETGDFTSVVNAYEDHDHIYEHLRRYGGLVMVRGRGIVASRILQRLYEERTNNPNIHIIHLLRSPIAQGHTYGKSRREVINHFEFQPFNWPRGCWTGQQRKQLEQASPEKRKELLEIWGGTTTARRKDWIDITNKGLREGWYQIVFGEVERVERNAKGELVTVVKGRDNTGTLHYATDFIIDATGLDAKVKVNPLLRDLVEHYNLQLNPLERLHVEDDFEVPGMRNNTGRMYAAGAMTLGGPNAGVDTFLGLQYAAYRSVDSLRKIRALGIRKLNGLRSVNQWLKWARGVQP